MTYIRVILFVILSFAFVLGISGLILSKDVLYCSSDGAKLIEYGKTHSQSFELESLPVNEDMFKMYITDKKTKCILIVPSGNQRIHTAKEFVPMATIPYNTVRYIDEIVNKLSLIV